MACTMFGHALGRHLNQSAIGVAIIHHTAQLHGEQFGYFRPEQRRGAVFIDEGDYSSKNKHALSLQPTASFSGEFSLIVQFDEYAEISVQEVKTFLMRARLAGGQILEHGKPSVFTSENELRQQIRSGYWLIDRCDLMQKANGEDWLDVLLRVTAKRDWRKPSDSLPAADAPNDDDDTEDNDTDDSSEDSWQQQEIRTPLRSSWIVPTTLGYALLTAAVARAGAREGYPHAFAEPLVGPVQYVSPRNYGDRTLPVWQHDWPRDDVFLLSQPNLEI
jgi:CRISPR-associated protein Csy2